MFQIKLREKRSLRIIESYSEKAGMGEEITTLPVLKP